MMSLLAIAAALAGSAPMPSCAAPSWRPADAPYEVSSTIAELGHDTALKAAFSLYGDARDDALRALAEQRARRSWRGVPRGLLDDNVMLSLGLELGLPGAEALAARSFTWLPDTAPGKVHETEFRRVRLLSAGRAALVRGEVQEAARWLAMSAELHEGVDHHAPPRDERTRYELGWAWGLLGEVGGHAALGQLLPERWPRSEVPLSAVAIASLAPEAQPRTGLALCIDKAQENCPFARTDLALPIPSACRQPLDTSTDDAAWRGREPTRPASALLRQSGSLFNPDRWVWLLDRADPVGPLADALVAAKRYHDDGPPALTALAAWVDSHRAEEDPARQTALQGRDLLLRTLRDEPGAEEAAFEQAGIDPWLFGRCTIVLRQGVGAEQHGALVEARRRYQEALVTGCDSEELRYRLAWLAWAEGDDAQAIAVLGSLARARPHPARTPASSPLLATVMEDLAWMRDEAFRGRRFSR